jgi:hypothetical protein
MQAFVRDVRRQPTTPGTDFDTCLRLSAEAFVKFRYSYEGPMGDFEGWIADPIRECVRGRILELHPDWANILNLTPAPPGKSVP